MRNKMYVPIGKASARVNYGGSFGTENWLITPGMFPTVGDSLTFSVKTDNIFPAVKDPTSLNVKISRASSNVNDFTVTALTLRTKMGISKTWTQHKIDLSPYAGSMIYVAFQVLDTNGINIFLDEVHGAEVLPSTDCSAPKDIAISGLAATFAALSWTETGFASSWAVEYSTSSDFAGAVSQTVTGTPSLSLSGLTDNTVYYVRIKADCLGGEYSEWSTVSFKTKCVYLTGTINLREQFDSISVGSLPTCWSKISSHTTFPSVEGRDTTSGVFTNAVKFGESDSAYLVLPPFGVPLNTLQVDFLLNKEGSLSGTFQVGYMTDNTDARTFVPVASFNDDESSLKKNQKIYLGQNYKLMLLLNQLVSLQILKKLRSISMPVPKKW